MKHADVEIGTNFFVFTAFTMWTASVRLISDMTFLVSSPVVRDFIISKLYQKEKKKDKINEVKNFDRKD